MEKKQSTVMYENQSTSIDNTLLNGYIIFKLKNENVAIRLEYVQEVFNASQIRPVPKLSIKFDGVYNLRNNILPILNFEYCVFENSEHQDERINHAKKIVVVNYMDQLFGIVVDEINNIGEFDSDNFNQVPEIVSSAIKMDFIETMAFYNGMPVKILDLDAIIKNKFPFLNKFDSSRSKAQNGDTVETEVISQSGEIKLRLNNDQKDAFKEIMNIASGKAIIAMSSLMKNKVKIDINVEYVDIKDLLDLIRSNVVEQDEIIVGIRATISKDMNGVIFLLFSLKKLAIFLNEVEITQEKIAKVAKLEDLTKDTKSSIQEIGNIIISHFCAGISDFLGIDLYHEVPQLAVAEYSALIDGEIARLSRDSDQALFMKTKIQAKSQNIDSEIVFIPYYDSIKKFTEWLNVDQVLHALEERRKRMLDPNYIPTISDTNKSSEQPAPQTTVAKPTTTTSTTATKSTPPTATTTAKPTTTTSTTATKTTTTTSTTAAKPATTTSTTTKPPTSTSTTAAKPATTTSTTTKSTTSTSTTAAKPATTTSTTTKSTTTTTTTPKTDNISEKTVDSSSATISNSSSNPYFNKVTSQKEYELDQKLAQEIKISGEDLDVFRELGNMGAGNAGNALSQILNKKVFLEIPPAKVLNLSVLGEKFNDASKKMIGLIGTTQGFFTSNIFLYFETEHVENLLQDLLNSKTKKKLLKESDLDEKERSAIQEISSILMSHYVAAISNFIQKKIDPPEYQFFFKNIKVLLNDLIKASKEQELRAIIVETNLKVEENIDIKGEFILVLTPDIVHQIKARILEVW